MKIKIKLLSAIILLSLLNGCSADSPFSLIFNSPKCRIISITEINFPDFGWPTMDITVQNTGDGPTAYSVGCFIKLKNGDHIVDETSVYYGTLKERESETERALFSKLKSKSAYYTEIVLYWYDAEDNYYEERQ